jgi:hypothetical protein
MDNYEKDDVTDTDVDEREKHWEVVERILFIYSKVNTAVKYVQVVCWLFYFLNKWEKF